jgi:hypothetical protein
VGLAGARRRRREHPLRRRLGRGRHPDAIRDYAQTIDAIARQLEDARAAGAPDTIRVLPAQATEAA